MAYNDPLLSTLTAVGLSDKEARVYIALLSLGTGAAATAIAERANIKRSIVYFTLENLIHRGYAQELHGEKVKRFAPVEPVRLLQFAQANAENLRMMLPLLRGMYQGIGNMPSVELHEGKEAILPVYRSMENGHRSYYLTNWEDMYEHFPEEVARWGVAAANPKNPNHTKNLVVDSEASRDIRKKMHGNSKQEFRMLPKNTDFHMCFGISDSILAITNFDPLFVVVIHSPQVVSCAALLFELAWQSGKEMK